MSLRKFAVGFFRSEPDEPVVDWAERNLVFTQRITETPGPYTTRLHPYVREVLECFRDPTVTDVCLPWGTQTAKTTTYYVGLAWTIDRRPTSALWAMDSEDNVRSLSKNRWMPMVDDCPVLARHKPPNHDHFTVLEQAFDHCTVRFVGSNSPGRIASTPVGLAIQDEVDKYKEGTRREASAVRLIDERTKGFKGAKRFKSSTPTVEDGPIWQDWLASDQRYYMVPCPHCGYRQRLVWEQVKWDNEAAREDGTYDMRRVKATARYECKSCGGRITDAHKTRMLREGQWVPTNPDAAPGRRGYHLNSLYSPAVTFSQAAMKFLADKGQPDGLRNFVNSWLAEPWKEKTVVATPAELEAAVGNYDRGDILGAPRVMTVDVQRTDLRFLVRGYDGGRSYLLEHGARAAWEDLDEIQATFGVDHVAVDTGYGERAQECYEEIFKRQGRGWIALKGQEKLSLPLQVKRIAPFTGRRSGGLMAQSIRLMHVNTELWKAEMAKRRAGKVPEWTVYRQPAPGYVRELFCEYQAERTEGGRRKMVWKQKHADNHCWDLEVYQMAVAQWLGLGKVKPRAPAPPPAKPKADEAEEKPQPASTRIDTSTTRRYVPISKRRTDSGE